MRASGMGFMPAAYESYEANLLRYRKKRIVSDAAQKAIADMMSPGIDVDSVCADLDKAIKSDTGTSVGIDAKQAMLSFVENISNAGEGRCKTGIADLDRMTGGFRGGKLVVLGARPGVGKTSLALYIARNVMEKTGRVLMVSLEMDEA